MGLSSALFSSVSGLDATGTAISVIGDNIANVNTPGFKARRAEFGDVLGQSIAGVGAFSQVGAGTSLQRVAPIFSQGTIESTSRVTDLAIEGAGFFSLEGPRGRFYSRAGIFNFDETGLLVNSQGLRVQGYAIDPATQLPGGALGDIQLTTSLAPPRPTTEVEISANLDANVDPLANVFDPTDPFRSSDASTSITLYDSLGNGHSVGFFYDKTAADTWEWRAGVDPAESAIAAGPGELTVVQGQGTLTFDTDGNLTAFTGSPITFEFAGATPGQVVDLSFGPVATIGTGDPTTQYAAESATNSFSQDGFAAGSLQSIVIDLDGVISGQFTNGETIPLAQLGLANFPNVEGLVSVGNNNLIESRSSGQALIGQPRTGGFGAIRSSNLEGSNVDLAAEFVRLIINQRAFQANTRTVSTTNELLANLVTLGQ